MVVLPPCPGAIIFTLHLEQAPGQTAEMDSYDFVVPPFQGSLSPGQMPVSDCGLLSSLCTSRKSQVLNLWTFSPASVRRQFAAPGTAAGQPESGHVDIVNSVTGTI